VTLPHWSRRGERSCNTRRQSKGAGQHRLREGVQEGDRLAQTRQDLAALRAAPQVSLAGRPFWRGKVLIDVRRELFSCQVPLIVLCHAVLHAGCSLNLVD
jgi:hypothetical protein